MSRKNNLSTRKRQHDFDLKREKAEKEKLEKKRQKMQKRKNSAMQIDKSKGINKKRKGFLVGKGKKSKVKVHAQLKNAIEKMEVDKSK